MRINIDFIMKLSLTAGSNHMIITFVNALTKQLDYLVTLEKTLSMEKFARIFMNFYIGF
jgi:hypothetical protein